MWFTDLRNELSFLAETLVERAALLQTANLECCVSLTGQLRRLETSLESIEFFPTRAYTERVFRLSVFGDYTSLFTRRPFAAVRRGWVMQWLGPAMGQFPFDEAGLEPRVYDYSWDEDEGEEW